MKEISLFGHSKIENSGMRKIKEETQKYFVESGTL
jgi:hypothetical protein